MELQSAQDVLLKHPHAYSGSLICSRKRTLVAIASIMFPVLFTRDMAPFIKHEPSDLS